MPDTSNNEARQVPLAMNSDYELLEKEEHRAEKQFWNGVITLSIGGTVVSFVIVLVLVALRLTDNQLNPLAPEQISSGIQMMAAIFAAILAMSIATANRQSPIDLPTEGSAAEAQYHAERLVTNRKLQNLSRFLGMINVIIGETLFFNLIWAFLRGDMKDTAVPEVIFTMLMIIALGSATAIVASAVHTPEASSLIEARKASYVEKRKAKVHFLLAEISDQPGKTDANGEESSERTCPKIIRLLCRWRIRDFAQRNCLLFLWIFFAVVAFPPLKIFRQFDSSEKWIIFAAPIVAIAIHLCSAVLSSHPWERICTSLNDDRDWFTKEAKKIRCQQKMPLFVTVLILLIGLIIGGCLPTGTIREVLGALLALISVFVIPGCLSTFVWSIRFQAQTGLLTAGNPGEIERFFINRMHAPHDKTTEEQVEGTRDSTGKTSSRKRCDTINQAQATAIKILDVSESLEGKPDKKTILAEYEKDGDTVNFSAKFWANVVSSI